MRPVSVRVTHISVLKMPHDTFQDPGTGNYMQRGIRSCAMMISGGT